MICRVRSATAGGPQGGLQLLSVKPSPSPFFASFVFSTEKGGRDTQHLTVTGRSAVEQVGYTRHMAVEENWEYHKPLDLKGAF